MDFSILYALQHLHNAVLDRVMVGITSLGNAGWIWIALTAVFLILPKYRKCGVRMAIALILDLILCNLVLKPLAARPRPCWIDEQVKLLVAAPKDYSFPSGHSAASFAAAVSIFVMHKKEGAAALILACLIASVCAFPDRCPSGNCGWFYLCFSGCEDPERFSSSFSRSIKRNESIRYRISSGLERSDSKISLIFSRR